MPSAMSKKALEKGMITQKQYNNLPPALLEAVVKSKMKNGGGMKKPNKVKPVKKPYKPKGKAGDNMVKPKKGKGKK